MLVVGKSDSARLWSYLWSSRRTGGSNHDDAGDRHKDADEYADPRIERIQEPRPQQQQQNDRRTCGLTSVRGFLRLDHELLKKSGSGASRRRRAGVGVV